MTIAGWIQVLALVAAPQEAIKLMSGDGGGFLNTNSAHPFENPTGLSNFVEILLMLLIPAAFTATFGRMIGRRRQGWALYVAMLVMFLGGTAAIYAAEVHGTPAQHATGLHTHVIAGSLGPRRIAPFGLGTLRTDTPTFVIFLVGFVLIFAVLTFLSVLVLAPFAQALSSRMLG